jgi:hypothetical protein
MAQVLDEAAFVTVQRRPRHRSAQASGGGGRSTDRPYPHGHEPSSKLPEPQASGTVVSSAGLVSSRLNDLQNSRTQEKGERSPRVQGASGSWRF